MDIDNEQYNDLQMDDYVPDITLEAAIVEYTNKIDKFKYNLYEIKVQKDQQHSANSLDPLYDYQAVYLSCVGYWISLLGKTKSNAPQIQELEQQFEEISNMTTKFKEQSHDARTLCFNVLLKKSTEHPYIFPGNM